MDNKSELFDLEREKRELDAFLSTIAEDEKSAALPVKEAVPKKESLPPLAEIKSGFDSTDQEPSGFKFEMPPLKTTEGVSKQSTHKDKVYTPSVNEFIPRFTPDAVSLELGGESGSSLEKTSSLFSLDDEKKTEAPRITVSQGVKPLESFKTMTRFDGTMKSDGRLLAEMPPLVEKKASAEIGTEKKIDKTSAYDFTPEKKSVGKGKWIWILIVLLILLLAGYFWISPKLSVPGFGGFSKMERSVSTSSVKEIKLLSVRQRLVYNIKLGKSIRVVEGIAENSASFPVSKIKIVANLYNADGSVLAFRESFCGNILIDKKLESLDEAGLISDLNQGKASEDKIPPKGQVPFMVVFTSELAGVHKLSVIPVDFIKH